MLQYPNKMTFDIMENGGVNPPPIGLLQVKVFVLTSFQPSVSSVLAPVKMLP